VEWRLWLEGRVPFLEARGIEFVIKPRRNSWLDTGLRGRWLAIGLIREVGYEVWIRLTGYGGGRLWRRLI
jgi:hypothetical protein